jgi:membrane fusion protein (multidrug efflux system)
MTAPAQLSATFRVVASLLLLVVVVGGGALIYLWKTFGDAAAAQAAASQPPPMWAVESAEVHTQSFARSTTSIGTVRALQSITLRNELPGTVHKVSLQTGQVVDAGAVLVELDVAVEQAELQALEAESKLAASMLARMEQALSKQGASAADVDRARAEHDKALANVARTKAVIERKRLRAPFHARVGFVDLHVEVEPHDGAFSVEVVTDGIERGAIGLNIGDQNAIYGTGTYGTATMAGAGRRKCFTELPLAADGRNVVLKATYTGSERFAIFGYAIGMVPEVLPRQWTE